MREIICQKKNIYQSVIDKKGVKYTLPAKKKYTPTCHVDHSRNHFFLLIFVFLFRLSHDYTRYTFFEKKNYVWWYPFQKSLFLLSAFHVYFW